MRWPRARNHTLLISLFLSVQGLELVFDVPVGLIKDAPGYLRHMPFKDFLVNWSLLAGIDSALNFFISACCAAIAWSVCLFFPRLRSRIEAPFVFSLLFIFLSASIYDIYEIGFPSLVPHPSPRGFIAGASLIFAGAIAFAGWRFADFPTLRQRLQRLGLIYSGAVLLLLPLLVGVRVVGLEHISMPSQGQTAADDAPNIIYVIADALSAPAMSVYGSALPTTPQLEQLRRSGTVFENLSAVENWTAPTSASLISGVEPSRHGIFTEESYFLDTPDFSRKYFLPATLRAAGYSTASIVQNGFSSPVHQGIENQFDEIHEPAARCDSVSLLRDRFIGAQPAYVTSLFNLLHHTLRLIVAAKCARDTVTDAPPGAAYEIALRYVDSRRDHKAPFFLWVHTVAPHDPYLPPAPHKGTFYRGDGFATRRSFGSLTDKHLLTLRYAENVHYVDQEFANFFAALRARHLLSHTIVMFSADHGETFRRWTYHGGPFLDEDLTHIPLIAWGPGIPAGMTLKQRISQIDIAPTILALAHLAPPAQMQGVSFAPLLQGKTIPSHPIYSAHLIENGRWQMFDKGTFAIIDGDWKYIQYMNPRSEELFDLSRDRQERRNLARARPDLVMRLRNELDAHFAGRKNPYDTL